MASSYLASALALVTCAVPTAVQPAHHSYNVTIALDAAPSYRPRGVAPAAWHSRLSPAEQERWLLAAVAWMECRGGGQACMRGTIHVVMNRAAARRISVTDAIYQRLQFSCWYDQNREALRRVAEMPEHSPDRIAWTMARGWARMALDGHDADPTRGATFYYARSIKAPAWVHDRGMVRTVALAGHVFYRKVRA